MLPGRSRTSETALRASIILMVPMNPTLFKFFGLTCALACCLSCGQSEVPSAAASPGEQASLVVASEQQDELDASTDKDLPPRAVPVYSRDIEPLLDKYCLSCHDSISAQGGVVLESPPRWNSRSQTEITPAARGR